MNSLSDLEIFELGKALTEALNGNSEAIADVVVLYERHPEMFKNIKDLIETIERVIGEPDLVMKNPKAKNEKDFIAAKKLDTKKMGDVGIRNNDGTNVIFHANKINIEKFKQYEKKQAMVGTPNSHTQAQSLDERLVPKNISSPASSIVSKNAKPKPKAIESSNDLNIPSLDMVLFKVF